MAARVNGLHHVTSGVWGAQEDIDFFTQVVGQRMIKQTILFDGTVSFYHLYYANADAEVGSVSTTFPFSKMGIKGRAGLRPDRLHRLFGAGRARCRSGATISRSTRRISSTRASASARRRCASGIRPASNSR